MRRWIELGIAIAVGAIVFYKLRKGEPLRFTVNMTDDIIRY